jgi:hypothetical protein
LGLVFFTYVVLSANGFRRQTEIVGAVWLLSFSQIFAGSIHFSPLFVVLIFTGILAIRGLGQLAVKPKRIFLGHVV